MQFYSPALRNRTRFKDTLMDQYEQFWHDGFMVLDTGLSEKTIDHLIKNVKPFWQDKKPHGSGYHDSNRVQDAWYSVPEVKQVATHPLIVDTLRKLYGRTPLPFQTLNFKKGTGQRPHADSIHFNSEPFGLMCGVWVALEDVSVDQGPLVYYPGSQQLGEINFEDAQLDADYKYYPQYEDYIESVIKLHNYTPQYGIVKKGQAIIWSANILHGGAPQIKSELTRYSQVTHYL